MEFLMEFISFDQGIDAALVLVDFHTLDPLWNRLVKNHIQNA